MCQETLAAVALSRVPAVGAKLFRALVDHFGSPTAVLRAPAKELVRVDGVAARTADHFRGEGHLRAADKILGFAERNGIDVFWIGEGGGYPSALGEFTTAPAVLYHWGQTDFGNNRTLAVVGTRRMSGLGGQQVERLLDPLADYAPLVISGLAYGVDVAAHRRALQLGLPTLAVLGSGFQHIYPRAHQQLARQLCEQGGGLLTEYPPWVSPEREHFPARNRIVAMLARITVVVESDTRGGSMITARMAHEYGRKVGACPGRGGDVRTAGCNVLIKTGKAHLIEDGEDVVKLLGWRGKRGVLRQMDLFELSPEERQLVEQLGRAESLSIDELYRLLGLPPGKLSELLLGLEIQGLVRALPGHRYRMVG